MAARGSQQLGDRKVVAVGKGSCERLAQNLRSFGEEFVRDCVWCDERADSKRACRRQRGGLDRIEVRRPRYGRNSDRK
jgi:hypothetical protein